MIDYAKLKGLGCWDNPGLTPCGTEPKQLLQKNNESPTLSQPDCSDTLSWLFLNLFQDLMAFIWKIFYLQSIFFSKTLVQALTAHYTGIS